MWLGAAFVAFTLTIGLVLLLWKRRRLYFLSWQLPGPFALPILGCGLHFVGQPEEVFSKTIKMINRYRKPFRIWFGPDLVVLFTHPDHLEKILTSTRVTYKHKFYRFVGDYVGKGLITNSGPEWKHDKKLIQPLFNIKFVMDSMDVFQNHCDRLTKTLQATKADGQTFDILDVLHYCYGDIISESVLGYELGSQQGRNTSFVKATVEVYDLLFNRFVKPWYYPELVFARTQHGARRTVVQKETQDFIVEAVNHHRNGSSGANWDESVDGVRTVSPFESIVTKNDPTMTEQRLVDHGITLYNASEDTMATVAAFTCICLGVHPKYQQKAAEEIRAVIGEEPRHIAYGELNNLKYLEMCVKESLRLFPIAPIVLRSVTEPITIDKLQLPAGSSILMPFYVVHRDPSLWQYPDEYYPDHFLPDAVAQRHPYAFLPFSSGPRGCIGKTFAYAGLKILMANLLQNFTIESDMDIHTLRLKMDISIRSIEGYKIRLRKRLWR